jgi:hypothetical protein
MAAFALTDTDILVGGLDQSCFSDTITLDRQGDTVDVTTFCSGGWRQFVAGLSSWSATFGGPQDLAASTAATQFTPDEHYALNVGSAYTLTLVPSGDAEGVVAFGSQAILQQYTPITGSVGDAAKHNVMATPNLNAPLVRGVLATKATVTATGVGTARQISAVSSSQRLYAGVHLLTAGGTTPSITVAVQSDNAIGFPSPTTVATFTAQTTRGGLWTSVAGPITDDFFRFSWTVSGTSPSFVVRGFLGVQ